MSTSPASDIKVTAVEPCGDGWVRIVVEMIVDAHCLADVGGKMLSVAAKGAAAKKPLNR